MADLSPRFILDPRECLECGTTARARVRVATDEAEAWSPHTRPEGGTCFGRSMAMAPTPESRNAELSAELQALRARLAQFEADAKAKPAPAAKAKAKGRKGRK